MSLMDAGPEWTGPRPPTLLNDAIAKCLGREVMSWEFPATTWQGDFQLQRPILVIARMSARAMDQERRDNEKKGQRAALHSVISSHNRDYKICYDTYLQRPGALVDKGIRIRARIQVDPEGLVEEVTAIEEAPRLESQFRDCLVGVLRTLKFDPIAAATAKRIIDYPFRFEPGR